MAINENDVQELMRSGKMTPAELEQNFAATANPVSIQDWGACYSPATGQLSEYCTLMANAGVQITGVGMVAYSSDGATLLAVQYTNGFNGSVVMPSIGTTLYSQQKYGSSILCVVYGWTNQGNFYFSQVLPVGSC